MEYSLEAVKEVTNRIVERMIEISDQLTELDSKLGDGDMGISMQKGALAVKGVLEADSGDSIKTFLMQCAAAFNRAAPSTMGTLLSGSILAAARYAADKTYFTAEDVWELPELMAEAIAKRGHAAVGDKTILDAFVPYAVEFKETCRLSGDLKEGKERALAAAVAGMERTKGLVAKTGRASWLGDRNKEYPDAGAYMFCRIAEIF